MIVNFVQGLSALPSNCTLWTVTEASFPLQHKPPGSRSHLWMSISSCTVLLRLLCWSGALLTRAELFYLTKLTEKIWRVEGRRVTSVFCQQSQVVVWCCGKISRIAKCCRKNRSIALPAWTSSPWTLVSFNAGVKKAAAACGWDKTIPFNDSH